MTISEEQKEELKKAGFHIENEDSEDRDDADEDVSSSDDNDVYEDETDDM